jgi:hypothetical protein
MATCGVEIWCYMTVSRGSIGTLQHCIKDYKFWHFDKWSGCLIFIGERMCFAIQVLARLKAVIPLCFIT